MAGYDPQRDRRRRRVEDDEGPAPIDEMLGDDAAVGARLVGTVTTGVESTTPSRPVEPPSPVDAPPGPSPASGPPRRLAIGVALAFLALLIVLVVRRRRHRSSSAD